MRRRRSPGTPRREATVVLLLGVGTVLGVAFAAAEIAGADTQWIGALLGGALAAVAAALGMLGKAVLPQDVVDEHRPEAGADGGGETAAIVASGGEGLTRRRMLIAGGTLAGVGLGAATLAPLSTLGPDDSGLGSSPWREGVALVDEEGAPIAASSLEVGSFRTAYPRGSDPRELGSPLIVLRLRPADVLTRRDWAPQGVLAFSKICTHAGCAVAMLRYPLYRAHTAGPALVCPCHYSTFDPGRAGAVLFGPAGRALPQLPLRIAADGTLEAAGGLSAPVGPGWWGMPGA